MKQTSLTQGGGGRATGGFLLLLLCLTVVLGFLFKDAFRPHEVLFSNDGPLGVDKSASFKLPDGFNGCWMDLYWLGTNGNALPASITFTLMWLLGPVGYAKFYEPICLLWLGICAWMFFRTLKLPRGLSIVAALAATLNMNFFSNVCWGLGSRALTLGAAFLALAALSTRRRGNVWLNAALAGLAVGVGVIEGADNGVLFSFLISAFLLFQAWIENETLSKRLTSSVRLAIVALFAGFIACQALIPLIGLAKGSSTPSNPSNPQESPAEKWGFITQWSLPPMESLRVLIPGLYGYRMQTPDGSEYWGGVGGLLTNPEAFRRSSGAGEYAGVLVVLVGIWALVQSFRRGPSPSVKQTILSASSSAPSDERGKQVKQTILSAQGKGEANGSSIFSDRERKFIWFWAVTALVTLVFSWGWHAPFYRLLYPLPFFSSMRNPMKFMHLCHLTLMVLFGYGLLGLSRRYLETAANAVKRPASLFEKRWAIGSLAAFALSLVAFGIYAGCRSNLVQHLMAIGFPQAAQAGEIANFSIGEVGLFVLILLVSVATVLLIQFGVFAGSKAKWATVLLGLVVVLDLGRADVKWIQHYDYEDQYASNPILDILKDQPWQHRVAVLPPLLQNREMNILQSVYKGLWLQYHFQYYNIQSVDMSQEPRPPANKKAYLTAVGKSLTRYWELTNTRYIMGLAGGLADVMNQQFDPVQKRFKQRTAFEFTQSQGSPNVGAQTNAAGPWALIEFTGALPRAKVYTQWQVTVTNEATLSKLGDPGFDPAQTVLVNDDIPAPAASTGTNATVGTVEFASYSPKEIEMKVQASAPSVLLLNDQFDPAWKVWVNGQPAKLLRCNFIMRGVQVPTGASTVRFHFEPSMTGRNVTLAAIALGLVLCGLLFVIQPPEPSAPVAKETDREAELGERVKAGKP